MTVYAELGGSCQQIGGECPQGWVVMQGQRPSPEHVAQEGGLWAVQVPSPDDLQAALFAEERVWRDTALTALVWLRDRHRDQLEIGAGSTLTPEQFSGLLVYMQQLRDWPQSEAFPESSDRPEPPVFLERARIDQ